MKLDAETGWPVELDPSKGTDGVPFGRYRRCPTCRGAGTIRGGQCTTCQGVPYIPGHKKSHWCAVCLGKRPTVQNNTGVVTVSCMGPPSERDELNENLSALARELGNELDDISRGIVDDSDDPVEIMELHVSLYDLTRMLYERAITDPRLPPEIWLEHKDNHYPESPKRESYPVPQPKPPVDPEDSAKNSYGNGV